MEGAVAGTIVLGIGNMLWADEGFGVRAVEALHERYETPPGVTLLDGGTQGLLLLDHVCDARRVLVFDAIDYGLEPGALRVLRDEEIPAWAPAKMSLHQASFQEVIALARLRGRVPEAMTLIGVQPAVLADFGGSLTEPVRARLDEAVLIAVAELEAWGLPCVPREAPPGERLNSGAIALDAYEGGRPTALDACRVGDARFLNQRHEIESR
jgi:hydrogenase maturation protease